MRQIGIFDFTVISARRAAGGHALSLAGGSASVVGHDETGPVTRALRGALHIMAGSRSLVEAAAGFETLGRALPCCRWTRRHLLGSAPGLIFEAGDDLLVADTPAGLRELAGTFATELFQREGPGCFVAHETGEDDQGSSNW